MKSRCVYIRIQELRWHFFFNPLMGLYPREGQTGSPVPHSPEGLLVIGMGSESHTSLRWPPRTISTDIRGGPVGKTLCSSAGGLGLIPGQGIKSHMLKLRVHMQQLKILCVATKTQCSQINKQ